MKIHLLSAHNRYVVAPSGISANALADRTMAQWWETLQVCDAFGVPLGNRPLTHQSIIILKSAHGPDFRPHWGNTRITIDGQGLQGQMMIWKPGGRFGEEILDGDTIALSSPVKHRTGSWQFWRTEWRWITAEEASPFNLSANRQMPGPQSWERFKLFRVRHGELGLANSEVFVPSGGLERTATIRCDRPAPPGGARATISSGNDALLQVLDPVVHIPSGNQTANVRLRFNRPSPCEAPVSVVVRAQMSALKDWAEDSGDPVGNREEVQARLSTSPEFVLVTTPTPLRVDKPGNVIVQMMANAPLPNGRYRITGSSPPNTLNFQTTQAAISPVIEFTRGVTSQIVSLPVIPTSPANAQSPPRNGHCATIMLARLDANGTVIATTQEQWPVMVMF